MGLHQFDLKYLQKFKINDKVNIYLKTSIEAYYNLVWHMFRVWYIAVFLGMIVDQPMPPEKYK